MENIYQPLIGQEGQNKLCDSPIFLKPSAPNYNALVPPPFGLVGNECDH